MGQVLRKHGDASDKDQKQKGGKGSIKPSVDKNKNENIEDDFGLIQRESEILKSFRRPPAPRNRAKSSRISRKVLPTIESNDLEFISHEGKDTVHFTEQSTESKEVKKKQQTNLVPIVLTDKVKNKNNKKCSRSSSSSSDSSKSSIEDANDKEQSGGVDTGNEVVSLLTEDVGEDLSLKQGPCSHNDQTEDINQTSSSVEDNVDHQSDKDNKSDDDNEEKKEEKSEEEVSIEDNAEDLIELEVDKNTSSLVSEIMEEYNSKRMSHNTDEQSEKLSLSEESSTTESENEAENKQEEVKAEVDITASEELKSESEKIIKETAVEIMEEKSDMLMEAKPTITETEEEGNVMEEEAAAQEASAEEEVEEEEAEEEESMQTKL